MVEIGTNAVLYYSSLNSSWRTFSKKKGRHVTQSKCNQDFNEYKNTGVMFLLQHLISKFVPCVACFRIFVKCSISLTEGDVRV